ncbi:MAG TPA: ABC transporter permease [Gemmatimonadaceae bacterium]|jgi:predicted permease|nr:ABC transporter permease [Gemmatimonadaceae bacterium]
MTRRPFRLTHVERDVDEEIAFHIAEREKKLIAAGVSPDEAHARAMAQFGDIRAVRTEMLTIDQGRKRADVLSNIRQDATYALRTLVHNAGFTAVVLLILGLGIGANTSIFSLIDALMLRPLPVPHPEQLVAIGDQRRTQSVSTGTPRVDLLSYPLYMDVRDQNHVLSGAYATGRGGRLDVLIEKGAEPDHPRCRFVSGNYFTVLQVGATAGRVFTTEDDPTVVISDGYWHRRFGGSRDVIGRTLTVNGVPLTVIGVSQPDFTGDAVGQPTDIWLPLKWHPIVVAHTEWLKDRTISWLLVMGRLAPGVALAQARTEIQALAKTSLLDNATAADRGGIERSFGQHGVPVESGAMGFSYYRSAYAQALLTLMVAVGLVLLVVCANIANLLLARAAGRSREISVRIALGAGRGRLLQQLLTESVILAVAGSALGLLAALTGSAALLRVVGGGLSLAVHIDGRVLAFTVALSLLTAILFGLIPALRATGLDVASALRTQGRGIAGSGKLAIGKWLVVAQVALSMLLLVGAGMLSRSTMALANADIGVARGHLVLAEIDAERSGYQGPRLIALVRDLTERVKQIPGVLAVTSSENGIFSGTESGSTLQAEGFTARADSDTLVASDVVGADYFRSTGAHILQGRDIEARDNETAPKVAVVNETAARYFFPNGEAIGRHIQMDSVTWEIVGIVGDIQQTGVREPPVRRVYGPMVQQKIAPTGFKLEIRVAGDPARLVLPVRQTLLAADPSLAIYSVDPLTELVRDSIAKDRLVATLVSAFGILTLILAALGLYGVMAYATARRTGEFGLRMALGALPSAVERMVLREAILLTGFGMAIGLPVALAATRLMRGQLFGISFFDPPSIGLATVVLSVSAALAAFVPAMRASRVAPLEAIRAD